MSKWSNSFNDLETNSFEAASDFIENIRNKFVTGDWDKANEVLNKSNDQDDIYGDFEDLEVAGNPIMDEELQEDDSTASSKSDSGNDEIDMKLREENLRNKAEKKKNFDENYDESKESSSKVKYDIDNEEELALDAIKKKYEEQRERNKNEFGEDGEQIRFQYEGFRQGIYVRIVLKKVPYEFSEGFQSEIPVILGGLLPHEEAVGFVTARVKRHRWHKRILKSNDPLIFSIGWRRFQTLPVYTIEDPNERQRYLKYTPEHMHCHCTFYGPIVPPNTSLLAYQKTNRLKIKL
jgi:ribosome biogenesis protein BMS1